MTADGEDQMMGEEFLRDVDATRSELAALKRRASNLEQAVEHAKDEYYHKGRRDLVFEMLADVASGKTESTGGLCDWELERIKVREIDAYKKHPRPRKGIEVH